MKATLWVISNALFAWAAWDAVHGSEGAGRVFGFATWALFLMSALPAIVLSSKQKKEIGLKRSVPEWMTNGFDVFLALFLQYHGWTTLAVVTFLTMIFQTVLFGTNKKSSTQKEEEVTK